MKTAFMVMTVVFLLTSVTAVCSRVVAPNIMVNDVTANISASASSLAVEGDNVYVVWSDDRSGVSNIYFSRSTDEGETFSTDVLLSGENSDNANVWPSIVADESGGVYVVWTGADGPSLGTGVGVNVWFAKSADYGVSFDTPIQVTTNDGSVFPSIGVYNNYVHVFYASVVPGKGKGMPLANYLLSTSSDGGDNFQSPIQVNNQIPVENVSGNNNTSIDIDPLTGYIYMVWIDGRRVDGNDDIYFAKSTDNGSSIDNNVRVNGLATVWADYNKPNPTVSVGYNDTVYVAYPVYNGDTRIILAKSNDGGDSFTTEELLAHNDNYCSQNGYDIMALADGTIGAVMITDFHGEGGNVWFVQPNSQPLILNDVGADFKEPSLFLTDDGHAHAVWIDDRNTKGNDYNLYYARTKDFEVATIDPESFHFDNMYEWYGAITGEGIETEVTWNDTEDVEQVYMVIDIIENGIPEAEIIYLDFEISEDDGNTAKLLMYYSEEKGNDFFKKGSSYTINGYIGFNEGEEVPFYFILDNHGHIAEIHVYDNDYHHSIHNAEVYVQELDETFYTDGDGEALISFPETGDYHLDISAPGYATLYGYHIEIVDDVFDHIFDIGLSPEFVPCDPFALPHFEDFDHLTPTELPSCWMMLGEGHFNVTTEDEFSYSSPNSVNMFHDEESTALLVLPNFEKVNVSDLFIEFKAYWHGGNDVLEVGVVTDINDIHSFELVEALDISIFKITQFFDYSVSFDSYHGEHGHIAFRYGSDDSWGGVFIDDILVDVDYDKFFAGGSGTSTEPWQIATIEHLDNVRHFTGHGHSDKYFIQIDNIDFEDGGTKDDEGWEPIGDPWDPFTGHYDGNDSIIENLTINRPSESFVGLFGFTEGATIENVGLINASVSGGTNVGILIGQARGSSVISDCYSSGEVVNSGEDVGGLIGVIDNSYIYQSYSKADVTASHYVGGLVGLNEEGSIENSYSTGSVSGYVSIGGLVGENAGTIIDSYSTGYVSGSNDVGGLVGMDDSKGVTNSFWDTNTSGQEESQGGEGKSTIEMVSEATFGAWDFTDVWGIEEGDSYPYLLWQGNAEDHNYPPSYTLTLEVYPDETAGTVENLSGDGPFIAGTMVDLLAEAEDGYEFLNWRKDGSQISIEESFEYQMPAENVTLTAHFIAEGTDIFEVSIAVEPDGVGYTEGQGSYEEGDPVTVKAFSEDPSFVFENWIDDDTLDEETDNPYLFTMPDNDVNLTANFRPAISATIDPDSWSFPSFDDLEPVETIVTWNDATEVTAVYVQVNGHQEHFTYDVEPINEETATLYIGGKPDEKFGHKSKGELEFDGFVEFDIGDPAPFTLIFTDPKWEVDIWVYDEDTNDGIPYVTVHVVEEDETYVTDQWGDVEFSLREGNYNLNISQFGYIPLENYPITVEENLFDGNKFDIPMERDYNAYVEVIDSDPYEGEIDVSINTEFITITFERDIQEGIVGFGFGEITFIDEHSTNIGFNDIYITEGNVLNINVYDLLEYETEYTLTIPEGAVRDAEIEDIVMENDFVLTFTTEEEEFFSIEMLDGNIDFVYHEGDYFEVEFFIPDLPSILEGMTFSVDQYVMIDEETFVPETVIPDINVTPINDRRFRVFGTVGDVTNLGVISFDFYIVDPTGEDPIMVHSTSHFDPGSGSLFGIAFVGVNIPDGDIVESPRLSEFDNLYDTEQSISFIKAGEGMITYEPGLDIMSRFMYLQNFQSYVIIESDEEYYAEVYTDALNFLHDRSALVTLYDVDYDYFKIYHTDFLTPANYDSNIDPTANSTAEKSNGTLTFEVDGFSRYTVLQNLYELALEVDPIGAGTAENLTGDGPFAAGTQLDLLATAESGWQFANWEKDGANIYGNESFLYTMPAEDVTLTAIFVDETTDLYSVSIDIDPEGAGYTTGQGNYEEGQNVSVEAFENEGYVFVNWTDDGILDETDNPYSFLMPDDEVNLTANFRDFEHASIDPDYFEYDDFDDVEEIETVITWYDASDVEAIYVFVGEERVDFTFDIEDIDGETAELTMYPPSEKSNSGFLKDGSFIITGYIEFDAGDDSEFTIEIINPTWYVSIRVRDSETDTGIENAEVYIQETGETFYTDINGLIDISLPSGDYTLDITAFGYIAEMDYPITVEEVFDNNFYIELDKDPNVFVEVIETDPVHEETNVSITTNISITFERNIIDMGFGDITFEDEESNPLGYEDISITDGNVLYIELNHPLEYETEYTLTIPDYAVADAELDFIIMEEDLVLIFTTMINPFNDATLSDLTVDGTTVEGFDPAVLDYIVELPYGTTDIPVVGATANSAEADVEIEQASELPGTASVEVTAGDDVTQNTYTVEFIIADPEPSDDATLADLTVDGTTVDGFDPNVLSYSVELPYGTTDIPVVGAEANDDNASVDITQATEIPGTATVLVTAEDGETEINYTVEFSIESGIEEFDSYITLFPIPARDFLKVSSHQIIEAVKLYNISGQLLIDKTVNDNDVELDVSYLNSGVYFIQIHTLNAVETKRIQILRH